MNCERTLIASDQENGAVTARLSAMNLITASDKRYLSQFPAGRLEPERPLSGYTHLSVSTGVRTARAEGTSS